MPGIADCRQELLVTGRTAAVLRWTGALAAETLGGTKLGIGRFDLLDDHLVGPTVSQVIQILETRARRRRRLAKRHLPLVVHLVLGLVRLGLAVAPTLQSPLVEMRVVPAHDSMNDRVQAFARPIAPDHYAPPNRLPHLGHRARAQGTWSC